MIEATTEHLDKYGLNRREALRLEKALCALADFEFAVKCALGEVSGGSCWDHSRVCDAIRRIIDGDGR